MLAIVALHLLAGVVTGTTFGIRSLVVLVGIVVAQAPFALLAHGRTAIIAIGISFLAVQVGYLLGGLVRTITETDSSPVPFARPRRFW